MKLNIIYQQILLIVIIMQIIACASGSSLVTGKVRPPTDPESLKLYLEEPRNYEVIGLVEASSNAGFTTQGDMNYAVAELKKQAAKLGATGVLLTAEGDKSTAVFGTAGQGIFWAGTETAKVLKGRAIYVIDE